MIAPVAVKQPWRIFYMNTLSTLKTKDHPFYNFVITAGTVSCHYDNLLCCQWRQSCQIDDLLFSVTTTKQSTKQNSMHILWDVLYHNVAIIWTNHSTICGLHHLYLINIADILWLLWIPMFRSSSVYTHFREVVQFCLNYVDMLTVLLVCYNRHVLQCVCLYAYICICSISHEICTWFCFTLFTCGYIIFWLNHVIHLPIFFKIVLLASGQSYNCPGTSEVTLKDIGKINDNQTTTKHEQYV